MNIVCIGVIGLSVLLFGLYIRLGGFKTWYLARGTPIVMPQALHSMLIPLGITFIVCEVIASDLIPDKSIRGNLFIWLVMPMGIVSIILGIWNPRWLRPRWLVYLEDAYGVYMESLLKEAAKDPRGWERQVRTQEGLEKWAAKTNAELGYPPHPGQDKRKTEKRQTHKRTPKALQDLFESKNSSEDSK